MNALPESIAEDLVAARPASASSARRLRDWHGVAGIVSALSLFILVASGIALNHTQELGLYDSEITLPAVTAWYGLRPETPESGFRLGEAWLLSAGGRWRVGTTDLGDRRPLPVGAVSFGAWWVVAGADNLFLLQPDGRLVDQIRRDALPGVPVQAIGTSGNAIVLRTARGVFASTDAMEWTPHAADGVQWSRAERLPDAVRSSPGAAFAPGIQTERVVRDIHSGRILGRYGPYLVDAVAILLMLLSATGAWMYLRSQRRRSAARDAMR